MKLKHYSSEKLKKEIREIIGKYLNLKKYEVFFFGSRITEEGRERSDIDVGIEGPKKISGDLKVKIEEEIKEIPTLYTIDIVDFKDVSSDFYNVARQKTESIS